jgi:pimeloyl-ACP methyl ester carboxylesterase
MNPKPSYAEHRYRSSCGRLELFARHYPGEGPPLLLMHGLTRNSADFEPLAQHLAGQYRLIVPDQRGRGHSGWDSDPANYRPDIYAADMFALLDSLQLDRVTAIGTSMGGLIAMAMALMQMQRVKALVLNDVGAVIDPAGLARIQGYVGPSAIFTNWSDAAKACAATNEHALPNLAAEDWLAFARRTCREAPDGTIMFAYDPAIASSFSGPAANAPVVPIWPLWDMLSAMPVLVIRGEMSDLLSAETVTAMGARHAGPFVSVEVPNRGHAPMLDEVTAVTSIRDFLASHA